MVHEKKTELKILKNSQSIHKEWIRSHVQLGTQRLWLTFDEGIGGDQPSQQKVGAIR